MIRVNVISLSFISTPLITGSLRPGEVPVSDHFPAKPFAVPRMEKPVEVTRSVIFLTSDDAAFITGPDYVIDGGMLLEQSHQAKTEYRRSSRRSVPRCMPQRGSASTSRRSLGPAAMIAGSMPRADQAPA
jgi:hypothetical protein